METAESVTALALVIERAWSDHAQRWIAHAAGRAPRWAGTVDQVRDAVESGRAYLLVARQAGAVCLVVVVQADEREAVILAAGGNAPGGDLTDAVLPVIEAMHPRQSIRVQTQRLGLVKKLTARGYRASLWTMELSRAAT